MQRREFIGLIGASALIFPRPGYAQTNTGLPLVGLLMPQRQDVARERIAATRKGLQEAGFIEGTNYSLAIRVANGDFDRLHSLARELGALHPRLIVAGAAAASVVHAVLPEIPLVFTAVAADPIANGLAESYARPGGMATGNVMNAIGGEESLTEKRISLFKELVPRLTRLGMIAPPPPAVVVAGSRHLGDPTQKRFRDRILHLRCDTAVQQYIASHAFRCCLTKAYCRHIPRVGTCRPSDVLFNRRVGRLSPSWRLCSENIEWRQAGRSPNRAGEQVYSGDQSENRESAWRDHTPDFAGARR